MTPHHTSTHAWIQGIDDMTEQGTCKRCHELFEIMFTSNEAFKFPLESQCSLSDPGYPWFDWEQRLAAYMTKYHIVSINDIITTPPHLENTPYRRGIAAELVLHWDAYHLWRAIECFDLDFKRERRNLQEVAFNDFQRFSRASEKHATGDPSRALHEKTIASKSILIVSLLKEYDQLESKLPQLIADSVEIIPPLICIIVKFRGRVDQEAWQRLINGLISS